MKTEITWGIHKELYNLFLEDQDNFARLFYDPLFDEQVLQILLSKRDDLGQVIEPYNTNILSAEQCKDNLETVATYFTDFFFQNQQRTKKITARMEETASKA